MKSACSRSGSSCFRAERVPLHIFEPRYQELIGESLEHGSPFGIVYADDDGLRQVGTLATVTR